MSSPIVSRWPVLLRVDVSDADRAPDGTLADLGAERLFVAARDAYLERCATVDPASLDLRGTSVRRGSAPVSGVVTVSAGVVEIFKDRFTMSVRIRADGGGVAADVTAEFSTTGEIPASMRDEFIALAHRASHVH